MKLRRRGFLTGIGGAMIALPFLESLASPAEALEARRRCAVFVRSGNGVQQAAGGEPERFWPTAVGPLGDATLADRATSVLAPFAPRLSILKGLRRPFLPPEAGHPAAIPQCLTAQNLDADHQPLGWSADWRIASQLSPGETPLTLMAGPAAAMIGPSLSWSSASVRAPADTSPAVAFSRLMGVLALPAVLQERITSQRNSINDYVRDELSSLLSSPRLGARDRARLEQHLDAIRDFERAPDCTPPAGLEDAVGVFDDPEANDVRPEVVRRHLDLIAFAMSYDPKRVATLQIGEGDDQTRYLVDGVRLPPFHWVSHRIQSDGTEGEPIPDAELLHHAIDQIQLGFFAYLLDQLARYPSAVDGTLLDDCVAVWMNDLATGPGHGVVDVPWILAGTAGGNLRAGNFTDLGGDVTYDQVLNTIVTAVGCTNGAGGPVEDFGDPSLPGGRIEALVPI